MKLLREYTLGVVVEDGILGRGDDDPDNACISPWLITDSRRSARSACDRSRKGCDALSMSIYSSLDASSSPAIDVLHLLFKGVGSE